MNAKGHTRDTTFLSLKLAEKRGFIHRDYIAHCFRWSHVLKHMMKRQQYKTAKVLDIGCGRELPFPALLYSNKVAPQEYVGYDAGPILPEAIEQVSKGQMADRVSFYDKTPFGYESQEGQEQTFTHIICFEVLEHVEPNEMKEMLNRMQALCNAGGTIFISTPCWDRKSCAANHVNEMRYQALGWLFENLGFEIKDVWGTFASISDYKSHLSPAYLEVFEDLSGYYDSNVLSTILAPMLPALSRNALWELGPKQPKGYERQFTEPGDAPWGSSERWEDMGNA